MRHLLSRRVVFFGGKGGVGKTTCSCALALAAQREGRRVLIVSTDPAHSTSDIFGAAFGPTESEILPGLVGLEIDAEREARQYVAEVKARMAGLFSAAVVKEASRQIELAAGMPGVADVALFDRMAEIITARADEYDLVVFDTAPTGHSLRLLRMPELMGAWIDALSRRRREANEGKPGGQPTDGTPDRPDPVLELLQGRARRMAAVRQALTHADRVGFVLVLIPERLPIEETVRAAQALEESGMRVDGLVVNRVLPDAATGDYFAARKAQEQHYLAEIGRRLSGPPRVTVPLLPSDVQGHDALGLVGRFLLADPPAPR